MRLNSALLTHVSHLFTLKPTSGYLAAKALMAESSFPFKYRSKKATLNSFTIRWSRRESAPPFQSIGENNGRSE
ncbi:hypothetical protein BC351_37375 [Paenibacillus ferrarius]|uniref:Uncharacterized protein n=1 Tax=Paenibacillus ferrarius TaxID=1469647 RepID=A0A1V4HBN3_9BACL|nr:hypothetical protein [Paenibacillus ferrarius]OPH49348.1 hypothetical protein BC351_37375 [Paenibacillus ferrarius]